MKTLVLFSFVCNIAFVLAYSKRERAGKTFAFLTAFLKCHNDYRKKHGVPEMVLDYTETKVAQKYAEKIAEKDKLKHSHGRYGENLAWSWSASGPPAPEVSAKSACDKWYAEKPKYDFYNPGYVQAAGHFTAMVWKSSTKLGGGIANAANRGVYVVANYDPPGNVNNPRMFEANVLRP